jgi:hypothetical protein
VFVICFIDVRETFKWLFLFKNEAASSYEPNKEDASEIMRLASGVERKSPFLLPSFSYIKEATLFSGLYGYEKVIRPSHVRILVSLFAIEGLS